MIPGLVLVCVLLQGCVAATIAGAAVGATAAVVTTAVKVPIKVTGAAIDMATGDDEDDD